jgi:hypothetical protein
LEDICTIVLSGRVGDKKDESTMVRIEKKKPSSDTIKVFDKQ